VDEQGGLAGLITIEDIAEDMMGEIVQEHEVVRLLVWKEETDGTIIALGDAPIHEVSRLLGEDLPEDSLASTVAGLVTEVVGRVPAIGEKTMLSARVEAEVLESSPRRVEKIRLSVHTEALSSPEATEEETG
jgi:CBS domain containing-hemolysin-like protein